MNKQQPKHSQSCLEPPGLRASVLCSLLPCAILLSGILSDDAALAAGEKIVTLESRHQALLEQTQAQGRIPVIVRLRMELTPEVALDAQSAKAQREHLARLQQQVLDRLPSTACRKEAELGIKRFTLTPAFAMQADTRDLQKLLADPHVEEVIEDRAIPVTGG